MATPLTKIPARFPDLSDVDPTPPTDGDALVWVASTSKWTPTAIVAPDVPVASVFGRTGAVVAATNDYAVAQINGLPAALAAKADDSNTVHKTGAAQTVGPTTTFTHNVIVGDKFGVGTDDPQVPVDLGSTAGKKFLLYGQGGSDGFQSGLGVNTGTLLNAMSFFLGASANFSIDVANVVEAFPYPSGLTSKLTFIGSTGDFGAAGALTPGVVADALIPNGGIAWSSTNPGTLKARKPDGTLITLGS